MATVDLQDLYRLHLIDAAIHGIQREAASLDIGQKAAAKIKKIQPEYDAIVGEAHAAQTRLKDSELQAQGLDAKIKKFDAELYGGKVVNPREVEAIQKEIEILKKQRSDLDDVMLGLMETLPKLQSRAEKAEKVMQGFREEQAQKAEEGKGKRAELEAEFKQLVAKRKLAVSDVPKELLAKYEAIRKNHDGIGMAEVDKRAVCSRCGTNLPERLVNSAREGQMVTCENCRRILYWNQPI